MQQKECGAAAWYSGWLLAVVVQCVGYGLFSSCIYGGSLWSAYIGDLASSHATVLDARMLLVAGTGVGCLVARALDARGLRVCTSVSWACHGCVAICGVLISAMAPAPETLCLFAVAMGLAAAVPLILWFDGLLAIYRARGSVTCLVTIAAATMLAKATGLGLGAPGVSESLVCALCLGGLALSALCQAFLLKYDIEEATCDKLPPVGTYRLTIYMVVLVASFGVTAGLSGGVVHCSASALPSVEFSLGAMAVGACIVAYALLAKKIAALHFGQFIRLALVVAGAGFAFAPLMSAQALPALLLLIQGIGVIQGVAMTLLSVEICFERHLRMVDVMPLNYIVYVVCTCIAMEIPAFWTTMDAGSLMWSVISAIAVLAVVVVIPALPASSSTAATFSLDQLPENETYEHRTARLREDVAAKYGLSARETEVFELLVQGLTRTQIAERLALSSWTVKEYVSSVYGKVGVHSAKELMILVAGGPSTPTP